MNLGGMQKSERVKVRRNGKDKLGKQREKEEKDERLKGLIAKEEELLHGSNEVVGEKGGRSERNIQRGKENLNRD